MAPWGSIDVTLSLLIREPASGAEVRAILLGDKAPAIAGLFTGWLREPRTTSCIHAMWTGPEISSAMDIGQLAPEVRTATPPVQNATLSPLAGELVFLHIPGRMWDGATDPIFDIGLFYGDRARLLFPVGWLPGSVFAKVVPEDLRALDDLGRRIREGGRASLDWTLRA